jgi:hypothetical protein
LLRANGSCTLFSVMPRVHTVAAGETFIRIIHEAGFADWGLVWDHPNNAALRAAREPARLLAGDRVFLPDPRPKVEARPTFAAGDDPASVHRFRRRGRVKAYLSLVFEDEDGRRFPDHSYELRVDGQSYEGRTDGDGRLAVHVPFAARRGDVTLKAPDGRTVFRCRLSIGAREAKG